ncbi:MAG TPA: serine hydrolase domain-containing protein, partial [Gemmataceae bacterium]|nr:serine hydrolase domain-containing protein [Gemmataceae bacterium]
PPGGARGLWLLGGTPRQQRLAYVRAMLRQPPRAKPGTKFLYSNVGYVVAGVMAEEAADQEWEELVARTLFKPLDMKTAGFGAVLLTPGRLDQPLPHRHSGGANVVLDRGAFGDNPPALAPAGTVHCSLGDWAKFAAEHLKGERGEGTLLKAETYQKLHTPYGGGDYAFGWELSHGRLRHEGSNRYNFAIAELDLRGQTAVLAASNVAGPGEGACGRAVSLGRRLLKEAR